jgi:hypothetical protein
MEFTLYYDGRLTANAKAKYKHELRKHFHAQLKELWDQEPLSLVRDDLLKGSGPGQPPVVPVQRKNFEFAPLVHSKLHLVADLDITMLVPGPPGQIIRRGGDIDNRLKTLLDSFTMPDQNQTPDGSPDTGETPFFCLLEDDKLITGLGVKTDRLLLAGAEPDDVRLLIHIRTRAVVGTIFSAMLGS